MPGNMNIRDLLIVFAVVDSIVEARFRGRRGGGAKGGGGGSELERVRGHDESAGQNRVERRPGSPPRSPPFDRWIFRMPVISRLRNLHNCT